MNGKPIVARTENQQKLVEAFDENDLIFAVGPAGSGKTYTAIAPAVRALKNKTAKKYSVDETDSLNRFVVEKIHPDYCQFFKYKNTKPDLYVDLVDRKNKSFFGSAEKYKDICI